MTEEKTEKGTTWEEFLAGLTHVKDGMVLRLSSGPFDLRVGELDALAASVLLHITKAHEEDEEFKAANLEGILMSNFLWKLHEARQGQEPDEDGTYSMKSLLTKEAKAVLHAWWWLTWWASQQFGSDWDEPGADWKALPTDEALDLVEIRPLDKEEE